MFSITLCILLLLFTLCFPHSARGSHSTRSIDLTGKNQTWTPFNYARIYTNGDGLNITVKTDNVNKIFNRAYTTTSVESLGKNNTLSLAYSSNSTIGNALFLLEIGEIDAVPESLGSLFFMPPNLLLENNKPGAWTKNLGNTLGYTTSRSFIIPEFLMDKLIEIRFYIFTDRPGEHFLDVKKAVLTSSQF